MNNIAIKTKSNESIIDALARNNSTIKSLFHFEKPITFLIILLAIQKIKNMQYSKNTVVISRAEIQALAKGNDSKIGLRKLINNIRQDIETHNFFNQFMPNIGLKNVRTVLVKETALTNDMYQDLYIKFRVSLFEKFKIKSNYTIQSLEQIRACGENQRTILYTLTQPYAKSRKPLKLSVLEVRQYLKITADKYKKTKDLTVIIKRYCNKITEINDIKLEFEVKKIGKNTVGYWFYSEFKQQVKKLARTTTELPTAIQIQTTIQQQLTNWGVGKAQIDVWIYAFDKTTLEDAINQTINRKIKPNSQNNPAGYIYRILGDGEQQAAEKNTNIKVNDPTTILKQFGLSPAEIKAATNKLGAALSAVVNQCLREKNQLNNAVSLRNHFNQLADQYYQEIINSKNNAIGAN